MTAPPAAPVIRAAIRGDVEQLSLLRARLWPESTAEEHARELSDHFKDHAPQPSEIIVAELDGALVGFCEVSIRPCAEGCLSDRVGYLEGWYVLAEARRQGVGRALVAAGEAWARSLGCSEMASDAALDNDISAAAHAALGFTEVGLVRCFRKEL